MLRADYTHRDGIYFTPATASIVADPLGTQTRKYDLLDFRASLDLPNGLEIAAFLKNATKEKYFVQGLFSSGFSARSVGAPRTYGLDLAYAF